MAGLTHDGGGVPDRALRTSLARDALRGLSTVQLYLQRWGMTPQKPLARARERQPAAIAAWLEQHYPAIAKRAKAEGAVIYWGDETGISNQDQIGRILRAERPDAGGCPDRQAGHPEHDLGGEQSRPDAVHVLRRRLERRPVHRLPAAADQGRRPEGRPDRRQSEGAPCQAKVKTGSPRTPTRSSCATCRPTPGPQPTRG